MADRIERYLGRLEAELDGRVEGDRLEEILVEVEGHLRESEEAYIELGEPEELANRLAVEGFGESQIVEQFGLTKADSERGLQKWSQAIKFGALWSLAMIGFVVFGNDVPWIFPSLCAGFFVIGFLLYSRWRMLLRGILVSIAGSFIVGMIFFAGAWDASAGVGRVFPKWANDSQIIIGSSLTTIKSSLSKDQAIRRDLVKMENWWSTVGVAIHNGKGSREPMPRSERGGYLGYREGTWVWTDNPDIEVYGMLVSDERKAIVELDGRIEDAYRSIEVIESARQAGFAEKLVPILREIVGMIFGYGAFLFLVIGGAGSALRRLMELAWIGFRHSKGRKV